MSNDHEWLKSMSSDFIRRLRKAEYIHVRCVVGAPLIPELYPYDELIAAAEAKETGEAKAALAKELSEREAMCDLT